MLDVMMRPLRRVTALVPTLLALCSFLLPSGWTVCIGADGHVAVEPVAQAGAACCAPADAPSGTASCVPGPDSDCQDVELAFGAAGVPRPDPDAGAAQDGQWITLPGMTHPSPACLRPPQSPADMIAHPASGAGTTILRC